jgi:pyocin large subunit-like protein
MSNVRDNCDQSDAKKLLLLILATYCDRDGICYPSNETLARVTRKKRRTVQRMLKDLAAEGELEILESGRGRNQKRILHLKRYVARKGDKAMSRKGDKAMSRLNATRSGAKRAGTDIDLGIWQRDLSRPFRDT